jgi:hypothetical protein
MTVVEQRLHRVDDALPALRLGLGARAVDSIEEVEDSPPDTRFNRIHAGQATGRSRRQTLSALREEKSMV